MAFDKNLLLRDGGVAGNLTATLTGTGVDFGAGDRQALTYEMIVPQATGTTPTLDLKIQESDDNSAWRDFLAMPQVTAKGVYRVSGQSDARYRRCVMTVAGTTPNFGAVTLGPVFAGVGASF